jgi:hypothetical protein
MPKRDIRMSDGEIDRFLRAHDRAVIVAAPATGAPWAAIGRLEYDASDVRFSVPADDPVIALIDRDDRACCVVEQFPSYYEIIGVMLHGHATRQPDVAGADAAFHLDVDQVVSFDFAKLVETNTTQS